MHHLTLPLHPAQLDVYTDQLLNVDSPHYNIGGYIKLKGLLDIQKFRLAVRVAPKYFDVLKMRFDVDETGPVCYLQEDFDEMPLDAMDFSNTANPETEALNWMKIQFNAVLDTSSEKLFDQYLIRIAHDEYWFFGKYHHLIIDGYGFIVWAQYLAKKYKSLVDGEELDFSYPAYHTEAIQAFNYYKSEEYQADGRYWKEKFSNRPAKFLQKPNHSPAHSDKKSTTHSLVIPEHYRTLLEEIQQKSKFRLHQLTIAALLIHYGKSSEHSEFTFGIPVHKRGSRELRNTMGMFSGILPFKGHYNKDEILSDFLKSIAETQKNDYRYQQYLIGDLSRDLKINSSEGYLCEILINYELFNFNLNFGDELEATIFRLINEHEVNPLQICWQDYGLQQPLQLQLHYRNDYFNHQEIDLLAQRVLYILSQFPDFLDKKIGSIDIIPPDEKQLLKSLNDTAVSFEDEKNLIDLFENQVQRNPDALALIYKECRVTYRELNERSNQLAHYLKSCGVKEEALVPICVERSVDMIIGILGILKAGAAYVPIDPKYPEDRVSYMLADTHAATILTRSESRSKLPSNSKLKIIELDTETSFISRQSIGNLETTILPSQLSYVIYTSGSTGQPKGVMIEHRNAYTFLRWCQQEFSGSNFDIVYAGTSICFDLSVFEIFYPLSTGKPIRLLDNGMQIEEYLSQDKNVLINTVPTVVQGLLMEGVDLSNVTVMNMAGEPIPFQVSTRLDTENTEVRNLYGPTEDTTYSTVYKLKKGAPILIGKPISNSQVYIVSREMELVPLGMTGEICIAGTGIARGYLNKPELTKEKFITNTFGKEPGGKLYKTGDLGKWLPDGNLVYQGRLDDQVKIRGFRIELGEIQTVLEQSGLFNEAVVVAREDKAGAKQLVGYVVPKEKFDKQAIQSYLKNKLPDFMVPEFWVEMPQLPLTPNGKIDKKALPDPEPSKSTTNNYVAPRNALETKLAELWKEVLDVDQVGIYDNFFELGGHSLKAIQFISRLHKQLQIKIDIGKILSHPTINKLSEILASEKQSSYTGIPKVPIQEHYELSNAQKRIWVVSYFKGASTIYNSPGAYLIRGKLQVNAFQNALEKVIERHENLRTVFILVDNEPRQKILPSSNFDFSIYQVDLRTKANSKEYIENWLEEDSQKAFDLEKGPLMRLSLFHTAEEEFILGFTIHHIISDGWSKGILIKEFLEIYNSMVSGQEVSLPVLPIQYKDYAAWHKEFLKSQEEYWKRLYEKDPPVLQIPADFERPKILEYKGDILQESVSENTTKGLKELASRNGTTLNNILFALYAIHLAKQSNQDDVVIGSLVSGRSHVDLENLIGVFINFLPVRLTVSAKKSFAEYLNESFNSLTQAYTNQEYPFDLMVEKFLRKRDISRNPFFDTMVNFHSENDLNKRLEIKDELSPGQELTFQQLEFSKKDFFQSLLDFKLDIENTNQELKLNLSYNTRLFSKETMKLFLDRYQSLLKLVTDEPEFSLENYLQPGQQKDTGDTNQIDKSSLLPEMLPINICASFVAEPLQEYIEYWGNELELNIQPNFAPYNQVFQQLLNPEGLLYKNKGINILFVRLEDALRDQGHTSPKEQVVTLKQTYLELRNAMETAQRNTFIPFLIGIVPLQPVHSFSPEVADMVLELNRELELFVNNLPRFYILDLQKIASLYNVEELFDHKSDELGHIPFTQEYYAAIGTFIMRKVRAYKGPAYKVIALDCDNTLWKGVCGEIGASNVGIDGNFAYLQEFLLEKYNQGFLLTLCSKNNEEDVWEVFEKHPKMKLKREHIAAHQINWDPKPRNLVAIAEELNLGLNSFIFLDDSEFEVEQASLGCPEVLSIALPEDEPGNFPDFLNHIWAMDHFQVTEEDTMRNTMYQAEKQRKEEQVKYSSLKDFLQSLNMRVNIRALEEKDLERAVQLTLRTNQFNLNGIRKSPEEIARSIRQPNTINWIIEVKDRFGDYGIAGLLLARVSQTTLILETFLLSCRVLGRNVEEVILKELRNYCIVHGLNNVLALYQATPKNKPFTNFLQNTDWHLNAKTHNYSLFIKPSEQELLLK